MALHELRAKRATAYDSFKAIAAKADFKTEADQPEYDRLKAEVVSIDLAIKREEEARELEVKTALPATHQDKHATWATPESDPYASKAAAEARGLGTNKGLIVGGFAKALLIGGGSPFNALAAAKSSYGENHPVTVEIAKALSSGTGASGGFLIPPQYVAEIIELLRPRAVVRGANPRSMPMPRGTMVLPSQTSAATATYGSESATIAASQPTVGDIVASYKKLTALVPITNDLMRFADPAADAFVRDDLVKVIALREDLAFLLSDGTLDSPRGFTSFANMWAVQNAGVSGVWSTSGNSTAAVGGNFISSNGTYTLATVASELGGLVNKLDTANVPDIRRRWFMHPRSFNYLNNVQNSLGVYVYRDELSKGTLLGYPFSKSTQFPVNIHDASSTNNDCSFVLLVEMDDALLLDSMSLELSVSREASYIDATGATVSAFQKDQTLIRAIAEHDFQMRHPASIACAQFVRWAPAIS